MFNSSYSANPTGSTFVAQIGIAGVGSGCPPSSETDVVGLQDCSSSPTGDVILLTVKEVHKKAAVILSAAKCVTFWGHVWL